MTSIEALPDEALLAIFSHLDGASSELGRCACVCRRWRSLVRYVDSLCLRNIGAAPKTAELALGMLSRCHRLRSLTLIETDPTVADVLIKEVSTRVESIHLRGPFFYGWKEMNRCKKLSKLHFSTTTCGILVPMTSDMTNLRELVLEGMGSFFTFFDKLMESAVEHCPNLEKLVMKNRDPFKTRLMSSSITEAHFQGVDCTSVIMLETPNLKRVTIDSLGCVLCAPNLVELHLPSRCKDLIVLSLDNLALLTVDGEGWEFDEIHSIVELTSSVSELQLKASVSDPKPMKWRKFFRDLRNLRTFGLGGNLLQCFCQEVDRDVVRELKLSKLTIYPSRWCYQIESLKPLLEAMLDNCSSLEAVIVNLCDEPTTVLETLDFHGALLDMQSKYSHLKLV